MWPSTLARWSRSGVQGSHLCRFRRDCSADEQRRRRPGRRPLRPDTTAGSGLMAVNLWGVINGVQAFDAGHDRPGDGRRHRQHQAPKQGIRPIRRGWGLQRHQGRCEVAHRVLAHGPRNTEGCRISAHPLVPASPYTGSSAPNVRKASQRAPGTAGPGGRGELIAGSARGDFYILFADNDVNPAPWTKRARAMGGTTI